MTKPETMLMFVSCIDGRFAVVLWLVRLQNVADLKLGIQGVTVFCA